MAIVLCQMTTFGIEQFTNKRFSVRKKALIDIAFKRKKKHITRRLTLASISHGIHFILLNDSADSSTDHCQKTLQDFFVDLSQQVCLSAKPFHSSTHEGIPVYRSNKNICDLRAVLCHVVGQNLHLSSTRIKQFKHMPRSS